MADLAAVKPVIPGPGPLTWTVAALLLAVSDALAARFGAVTVRGELSGFTRAASGHCYFTLKDGSGAAAGIRCAMFRRAALSVGFRPQDGQQVELRGRLAVYEARGELQMVVEAMQRVGAGSLFEEFLRLRDRLQAEGLFEPTRKRVLPAFPERIGVVTSLAAAALHDVLTTLQRRAPHVAVMVYPCFVQGAEAPDSIVQALGQAARRREVDVLLLCRGGGSLEDLWAFNDERVVRAVALSPLPVICGVGHETDVTLADLAADLRAPTPTSAAEQVAPERESLSGDLDALASALAQRMTRCLDNAMQRLDRTALRLQRPSQWMARHGRQWAVLAQRLPAALQRQLAQSRWVEQRAGERLVRAARAALDRERSQAALWARRLAALDPKQVLARGYAWVESVDGQPMVRASQLQPGDDFRAVWADGDVRAQALQVRLSKG
jgi:exodeoxyribonuclease VII large subunit